MSEGDNHPVRLPPPAFPPGGRRHIARGPVVPLPEPEPAVFDDALIEPGEAIPERRDTMGGAIISPYEPLPDRSSEEESSGDAEIEPDEEGVVVGMDLDAHMDPTDLVSGGDPHVMELMRAVEKLAAGLRHRGEAGLAATSEMNRFEATLRAYCVGYLAARRSEDPPVPLIEEPLPTDG